jgi:vacuolar-type H+-ATPase subunit H
MNSAELVKNLLAIEERAAEIVNSAQKKADKRVMEADRSERANYEQKIKAEYQRLDALYTKKVEDEKIAQDKILAGYQAELGKIEGNQFAFSTVCLEALGFAHPHHLTPGA